MVNEASAQHQDDIAHEVATLNDRQAIAACRAFAVLLEEALHDAGAAPSSTPVDVTDMRGLVKQADAPERALYDRLSDSSLSEQDYAGAARRMLLLGAELGYADEVAQACAEAKEHVRDFGVLTGPLILAGLAVVLAWVPVEQREKITTTSAKKPDGTVTEEKTVERETIRVGAAAAEKLGPWLKSFLGAAQGRP